MSWDKLNTANWKGYLNIAILIGALFLSGAVTFPPGVSDATKQYILSWDSWLLTLVAGLNGVLHFIPDFTIPTPSASAKKVAALLIGALIAVSLLSLGAPSRARAEELKSGRNPPAPVVFPTPPTAPSIGGLVTGGGSVLQSIANWFNADSQAAIDLAYQFPTPPDGNGATCWAAGGQLSALLKAHPAILTGKPEDDMEAWRLATMRARAICDNVACQTVATEFATGIKTMAPVDLSLPTQNAFTDACLHVPHLASVALPTPAPTVAPAPTPAASATPTATPTSN